MRIGFIGAGKVASYIARLLHEDGHEVVFTLSRGGAISGVLSKFQQVTSLPNPAVLSTVDLVVEAASPTAVEAFSEEVLSHCDLCILSTTALRDADLDERLRHTAASTGHTLTLSSGGIIGIDGLQAVGRNLVSVEIETTKPPAMWGIDNHTGTKVLFDGSTRQACSRYEKNVNVHATVAYHSIGFDRCRSRLISDSGSSVATQRLKVMGDDFGWEIDLHSTPIGGVTGSLTPRIILKSVRDLLDSIMRLRAGERPASSVRF